MENRISAAENLIIQADADQWQLFQYDEFGTEREQLRISRDEPLRFSADFALTRRLPAAGKLPAKYVRQVVLGWSPGDQAWHLGILLASDIAGIRGSRWCEVANWPEPDPVVFEELAQQAGRGLADVLAVPFSIVPPKPGQQAPPPEPASLPDLPIDIGTWTLDQAGDNLIELRRAWRWRWTRYVRILWYSLLSIVYVVLSVATLQQELALPNSGIMLPVPELLPYLGIIAAVVCLGIVFYTVYELIVVPNRIQVDTTNGQIRALHGTRQRWHRQADDIQAVYVTHVVKSRRRNPVIQHGEINLLKHNGAFDHLLMQASRDDEQAPLDSTHHIEETVRPLEPSDRTSDLQAVGLYLARALGGLPAWYDQRGR